MARHPNLKRTQARRSRLLSSAKRAGRPQPFPKRISGGPSKAQQRATAKRGRVRTLRSAAAQRHPGSANRIAPR